MSVKTRAVPPGTNQAHNAISYLRTWRGGDMFWDSLPAALRRQFVRELAATLSGYAPQEGVQP